MCAGILESEARDFPTIEIKMKRLNDFVKELKTLPVAINTKDANLQHYEVNSLFFASCLGPQLKYSCCYYPPNVNTLHEAEAASLEQIIDRANVKDGISILELGSLYLYIWTNDLSFSCLLHLFYFFFNENITKAADGVVFVLL